MKTELGSFFTEYLQVMDVIHIHESHKYMRHIHMFCNRSLSDAVFNSFFYCFSQNQLLTKGMVILRDKIRFYEGENDWIDALDLFCSGLCQ